MKRFLFLISTLLIVTSAQSSELKSEKDSTVRVNGYVNWLISDIPTHKVFQISPRIGTDVGGGVPFGNLPQDFQPFPKLNVSIGLNLNYIITPRWHIGFDINYKTVEMSANAKMENEYFYADPTGQGGEKIEVYYTGIARQKMSFTLLEFPVVAKYGFGKRGKHCIVFGIYGAWVMQNEFSVVAKTGYQGTTPNDVTTVITEPLELDFSNQLNNWETGLVLGYEQRITSRLNADLMIYGGFNNIFKENILKYGLFPMRLSISLSYSLFNFS